MERFWKKVKKTRGCWFWTAYCTSNGYGRTQYNLREVYAHRASWEMHFGKIPKGSNVLHKCDTPSCVRPEHLFLGSQADNMRDMAIKRRSSSYKLSRKDVINIKRNYKSKNKTAIQMSKEYGVHKATIHNILSGKERKYG